MPGIGSDGRNNCADCDCLSFDRLLGIRLRVSAHGKANGRLMLGNCFPGEGRCKSRWPDRRAGKKGLLARNLERVAVVVDKNRVKSGRFAIQQLGADTLLLDDGMQYLDLAHGIDVVLIDAGSPFGTEALLPRGTLREPPKNLRRASYILLTKCNGRPNDELIARIRRHNRTAEIIESTHGPIHLENVFTRERRPLEFIKGKWVAAISAIAVPEAFEGSLEKLGARVELRRRFADHYRFSRKEVDRFMQRCVERDMQLIMTTEKDAVRFPKPTSIDVPVYFLRIEVEILKGREIWDDLIARICHPNPAREAVLNARKLLSR